MRNKTSIWACIISAALIFNSCSKSPDTDAIISIPPDTTSLPVPSPVTESFESGVKADYSTATVSLNSGKWSFDDALIGDQAEDKKNGAKSVRIRETGELSMNFDIINGVYSLIVANAVYGTDGPSTWQLWASYTSGNNYSQVGNTITTSSAVLKNDTFVVNSPGKVRFSIRKVSGGTNQLNIDDVQAVLIADPPAPAMADDDNMLMGNPSNATPSIITADNFFMDKGYYAISYNRNEGKANWISWHLKSSDLGTTPRQNNFREDFSIPSLWYHVGNASYTGSGFDRGHGCPSGDRTSSVEANSSTFLMTNIIPQAPQNNQQTWSQLEDSCRFLVQGGKELFIITGSFGTGGTGNNGDANTIDNGYVVVPQYVWKIIVVLPNGNNDLSRVSNSTRVIAVLSENTNSAIGDWKAYRVPVDNIESLTGYDFLSNIPVSVQQAVEAIADNL